MRQTVLRLCDGNERGCAVRVRTVLEAAVLWSKGGVQSSPCRRGDSRRWQARSKRPRGLMIAARHTFRIGVR